MRICFLSLFLGLVMSSLLLAQDRKFSIEALGGYAMGVSGGVNWATQGDSDSSFTYFSQKNNSVGNSGYHVEARLGYALSSELSGVLAAGLTMGFPSLQSGYEYNYSGGVTESWKQDFNYAFIKVMPALRYRLFNDHQLNLSVEAGPMLVIPSPINEMSTLATYSGSAWAMFEYGMGYGLETGLQGVYMMDKSWGISFGVVTEDISVPRKSVTTVTSNGYKTSYAYGGSPSTNANNQTASDISKSDSKDFYYTYPDTWDGFGDISFRTGIVWYL
jgi:hypothetical protein